MNQKVRGISLLFKLLVLTILLQHITIPVSGQMRKIFQDPNNPDNEVQKFSFYSASEGYVAFSSGIGYTLDSGRTFSEKRITFSNVDFNGYPVNLTFGFGINGVKAFDKNNLLVYGEYGLVPAILHSSNGGSSFKVIYHSQLDPLELKTGITDMVFPGNGKTGYAIDADRILRSTNSGLTWSVIHTERNGYFKNIEAVDTYTIFVIGASRLLKTTNGNLFLGVSIPNGQRLHYATFLSSGKGWINTSDNQQRGSTYFTSNGGETWTLQNDLRATPFTTNKMKFINDSVGYALHGLFTVYKTVDGGKVWERILRDNSFSYLGYSYNDLYVHDVNTLWAGGGHGMIEISANGGGVLHPGSYFRADTTNHLETGLVKLVNYSRPNYKYQWYVNDTLVGSTYHASYKHRRRSLTDRIMLVVSSGEKSDTSITNQYFNPPVIISSFTPHRGGIGTTITITGENFNNVTGVYFGNIKGSFTVQSPTTIKASVGNGASGSVLVTTATGYGSLDGFTFVPPPTISGFSPNKARSGEIVTINGSNFDSVISVSFGGIAASYNVVSSSLIKAIPAVGASGKIEVKTVGGTASKGDFTMLPVIKSFSPQFGTFGTIMSITGTGLGDIKYISVGGIPVSDFKINSATSITAVMGAGATGDVVVKTSTDSAKLSKFIYHDPPGVNLVTPAFGPAGTSVSITGKNFSEIPAENIVYFGAVRAAVTAASSTSLIVNVPRGATYESISVTTHNLTAYSKDPFLVTFSNGGSITPTSFEMQGLPPGTDKRPISSSATDFDGDGKVDLAVIAREIYSAKAGFSIFRNSSSDDVISFDDGIHYISTNPGGLAVGDIDGDGKIDIAVSDEDKALLRFFRNVSTPGNISFATPVEIATARFGRGLNLKDLDGDGKPDLVLSSWWEGKFIIHRNISNPGEISFDKRYDFNFTAERNVIIEDITGDHKPEIILSGNIILINNCARGSLKFQTFQAPGYIHSTIAVGDIDNDGRKDIVTTESYSSKIIVHRNITNNNVLQFAPEKQFHAPMSPRGISLADLDGDGRVDVGFGLDNSPLGVIKNISTPGNIDFSPSINYSQDAPVIGEDLSIADLNLDGRPDIISTYEVNKSIFIFTNRVKAEPFVQSFTPRMGTAGTVINITGANFTSITGVSFGGVPAANFRVNSPTSITAVVAAGNSGEVSVKSIIGKGSHPGFVFATPPVITDFQPRVGAPGSTVTINGRNFSVLPGDNIVHFGTTRAIVTEATANMLKVTVPYGITYGPVSVVTKGLSAYYNHYFVSTFEDGTDITTAAFDKGKDYENIYATRLADVDGDGKLDLVGTVSGSKLAVARNISQTDSIVFSPVAQFPFDNSVYTLGDINSDGKLDAITFKTKNTRDRYISVLLNSSSVGAINFKSQVDVFNINSYYPIRADIIVDLDEDGKPDIVYYDYDSHNVGVIKNTSNGDSLSFDQPVLYSTNGYARAVEVSDFDNDGKPDIIGLSGSTGQVAIFRNICVPGKIEFKQVNLLDVSPWLTAFAVVDIDADGKNDIATTSEYNNTISILRNISTPGNILLAPKVEYPVGSDPKHISVNDLDGDGLPELIVLQDMPRPNFDDKSAAAVYRNKSTPGNISLDLPVSFEAGIRGWYNESGDLNNDGKPELLITKNFGYRICKNQVGISSAITICPNSDTSIVSPIDGSEYQWQENKGDGFTDIVDNYVFTGAKTGKLSLKKIPAAWNKYQYRCVVDKVNITNTFQLSIEGTSITPTAKVSTTTTNICGGKTVLFKAVTIGGGQSPTHQWYLNGSPVGLNSDSLQIDNFQNGDQISFMLTSSETCAQPRQVTSDTIRMTVNTVVPAVNITSAPGIICPGSINFFYSHVTNGGANPTFQWFKSGVRVGANISTYSTNDLTESDSVYLYVTSNAPCAYPQTVRSNVIKVKSGLNLQPSIVINGSTTLNEGQAAQISSTVVNGGDPPQYRWQDSTATHNWQNIPGASQPVLNFKPQHDGHKLRCELKSNAVCAAASTVISNTLVFTVNEIETSPGVILPNPVLNILNIDSLKLSDKWVILEVVNLATGQIEVKKDITNQTRISVFVGALAPGMYAAVLKRSDGSQRALRFVKM